jgi:hypothetical protein
MYYISTCTLSYGYTSAARTVLGSLWQRASYSWPTAASAIDTCGTSLLTNKWLGWL